MPTPAGCLARGSVPGRREAQRERTFGCPVGAHASLAFSWARHAWHGGVEAGRSEPWPSGELRGPRGSSVAPGGARSLLGELRGSSVALGRATSGGARSPRGSSVALLCVGSWPRGAAQRLSLPYIIKLFLSSSRTSRSPFSIQEEARSGKCISGLDDAFDGFGSAASGRDEY